MTKLISYNFPSLSVSTRGINRARIISLIRTQPGLTRTDISKQSGLSKGTISKHVEELLNEGLLYEKSPGESRQRNTKLWLNRNAGYAVGLELSVDGCRGILTDMELKILKQVRYNLPSTRVEETIELLKDIIQELTAGLEDQCLGVAIAVPGPTDVHGGTILFSESLGWTDVPLANKLAAQISYPVTLINRPRAGLWGEYWCGIGSGCDDLIYVSISSGIAAGILINGQLFTGAFGNSGELGHTTILVDGLPCVCGNRGCLETVSSMPAILQSITQQLQQGSPSVLQEKYQQQKNIQYNDVIEAARDGDGLVQDEIRNAGRYIGIAIANLIDLFNPSQVIIGGQLAEAGEIILNPIRFTAQRSAFPLSFSGVKIVRNSLGEDSVCVGACVLVVDQHIAEVEPAMMLTSE
jgi:glucokinase-like ROK family protein